MSQNIFEISDEEEKDVASENIRILYNKLVSAIDKNMPLLEYTHPYIKFQLYKSHIEVMLLNDECSFYNLCLLLFKDLFEDNNECFKSYTKEKEDYVQKLIKVILKEKQNLDATNIDLAKQNEDLKNINFILKFMEIEPQFVFLINVHLMEKGITLENFINFLQPILVEKFPESNIDFSEAIKSQINLDVFYNKLQKIYCDEENYFTNSFNLKWDMEKEDLIFKRETNEEICTKINLINSKKKKKKKKNKINLSINAKKNNTPPNKIKNIEKQENEENVGAVEVKKEKKVEEIKLEKENKDIYSVEELYKIMNSLNVKFENEKKEQNSKIESLNEIVKEQNSKIESLNEIIKEQNVEIESLNEIIKEQNIKIEEFGKENKDLKKDITKLNKHKKKINYSFSRIKANLEKQEFILKMISLRTLYKSFFDIIIYLYGLNDNTKINTEKKINIIINYLKNDKSQEVSEFKSLLKDIYDLLKSGNNEAHYININGKLLIQLFELIKKHKNKVYPKLEEFMGETTFEKKLKELVSIRTKRYLMDKTTYEEKENIVINDIKKDEELKTKFLNKIF